MTEEEKKAAEEAAKAEAEAKAKAEADGQSDEEKAKEQEALKNLIAQERKAREEAEEAKKKAEKALLDKRLADKAKREAGETVDDEEKPLTPSELRTILAEERQSTQKELLGSQIAEKARKLADSDEEAELIVEIHRGRTFPMHLTIDQQLEESKAIALGKKLMAQNAELKRAQKGKETVVIDSGSTHKDAPKPNEPKLEAQDKAELSRLGFVWDGKFFSKKLANGKTLSRDWKSKKTFIR